MHSWPISRKLLAITTLMLFALSGLVGTVSILALQRNLIDRIDEQVNAGISIRVVGQIDQTMNPRSEEFPKGKRIGMLTATVLSGTISSVEYFAENGYNANIDDRTKGSLLAIPVDGKIRTIDLHELGLFRMAARNDTDNGTVLISGISLASAQTTITNLTYVFVFATLIAIVIALTIGSAAIRTSLNPLTSIADIASRIARKPLGEGTIETLEKIPDISDESEVGKVSQAINRMLTHIEESFSKRQQSEDRLRRFIADASHELRTPLSSIRGYSELALRDSANLNPQHEHAIQRIYSESLRMSSLVQELLLLARLDAGQELKKQHMDVRGLIADSVADAQVAGPDHHWVLDVPDHELAFDVDPSALQQVLSNLLSNARLHTPAGTTVTIKADISDAQSVIITVADDGPGVSEDVLPFLFERFVRGDDSRSRNAGSTGLGLSIARAIVKGHGGTLEVSSTPTGAQFTLLIPRT